MMQPIGLALVASLHFMVVAAMDDITVGDPLHGRRPPNGIQGISSLQTALASKSGKVSKSSKYVRSWPALDDTDSENPIYFKDFELKRVGEHVEIWVAIDRAFPDPKDCRNGLGLTDVTDKQLKNFADEFDKVIYPALSGTPDEPGVLSIPPYMDGEAGFLGNGDRIVVLVDNVRDQNFYDPLDPNGKTYTAGFVSPYILELTGRHVFTVDVFDWLHRSGSDPPNNYTPDDNHDDPYEKCAKDINREDTFASHPHLYEGVFAHEYCHLLSYYVKGLKDAWLEEGIADWAISVVGYDDPTLDPEDPRFPYDLGVFHGYYESYGGPEQSLTEWEDQGPPEILADYGAAYSFMLFLEARFGRNFLADLHNEGNAYSVPTFQAFLDNSTDTEGILFGDLMKEWQVAMVAYGELSSHSKAFASSSFSLANVAFTTVPLSRINWDTPQAYDSPGAPTNGADFVRLNGGNKLSNGDVVAFQGGTYGNLDMWEQRDQYLFSMAENNLNTAIVREIDLKAGNEIKLSIAYDIEELWDFFIVQLFDESTKEWISIAGDETVDYGYGFNAMLPGLTGTSPGFPSPVELIYTAPPQFSGLSQVKIALRYLTDMYEVNQGVDLHGMTVNNVPIADANDIGSWDSLIEDVDEWSATIVAFNKGGSDEVHADKVALSADNKVTLVAGVDFPVDKSIIGLIIGPIDTTGSKTGNAQYTLTVNGKAFGA